MDSLNNGVKVVVSSNGDRPITTLFMLMSLDGKISTGPTDEFDFDRDLSVIPDTMVGLQQYYEIEKTTDQWTALTGKTAAKIGVNTDDLTKIKKVDCSIVVFDNNYLSKSGVRYLHAKYNRVVIVTSDVRHPAVEFVKTFDNFRVMMISDLKNALDFLKLHEGIDRLTVQTGGTMNYEFLSRGLIDYVDIVVAPIIVGGSCTPTLVDGSGLSSISQLNEITKLRLIEVVQLKDSFIRMRYMVTH